jgi:regulator of sigma E protease
VISILATIVILGVLIFVHELGHFATAKWAGIEVPRFSIGLGPKMIGFTRGETEYVISWIPLGGYVRMAGMEDMEALEGEHDATEARSTGRDFESKSLPVRAMVISAGVIMNALFAWFLYAVISMAWGVVSVPPPVVGQVVEELVPAESSALLDIRPGARITHINGRSVSDFTDVQQMMAMAPDTIRIEFADAPPVTVRVPTGDALRRDMVTSLEPEFVIRPVVRQLSEPGSPADAAGLRVGDEVVAVNGQPISDWRELVVALEDSPGETLEMRVARDGSSSPCPSLQRPGWWETGRWAGSGSAAPCASGWARWPRWSMAGSRRCG